MYTAPAPHPPTPNLQSEQMSIRAKAKPPEL